MFLSYYVDRLASRGMNEDRMNASPDDQQVVEVQGSRGTGWF